MEAINHPVQAFQEERKVLSWCLVLLTVLINAVFEPVLRYCKNSNQGSIDYIHMLRLLVLGILSYVLICVGLWGICKCFGSKTTCKNHLFSWGITYIPTAICAVTVTVTEVFFYVFWNNVIWGMVFNIIFVGVLIWKILLFAIYLKEVAKLQGKACVGAGLLLCVIILLLAALNGFVGLKTPVL